MKNKALMYTRFERLWHWAQALLVVFLIITGFEIHGTYGLLGFEHSCTFHNYAGWTLIVLSVLAVFWHSVTGEWRQYLPSLRNITTVASYYLYGIFSSHSHPFKKTREKKLNPLQQLSYLVFILVLLPVQVLTGVLYLYPEWTAQVLNLPLEAVALVHTAMAFLMIAFFIVHVYMATTGETVLKYTKAMITGWEEIEQ